MINSVLFTGFDFSLNKTIYNASGCFIQVNIFCFYMHSVLICQRLYFIIDPLKRWQEYIFILVISYVTYN